MGPIAVPSKQPVSNSSRASPPSPAVTPIARCTGSIDIGPKAHVVGGSHAQRDVIDLTLIAAAARSGDVPLAEALLAARVERKPSAKAAGLELIRVNSHW